MYLSDEAERAWDEIAKGYVEKGYPAEFRFYPDAAEADAYLELVAADLFERKTPSAWALTYGGLERVLKEYEITDGAFDFLEATGRAYEAAKFPALASFQIRASTPEEGKLIRELTARSYFESANLSGGQALLSTFGRDWIMERRVG